MSDRDSADIEAKAAVLRADIRELISKRAFERDSNELTEVLIVMLATAFVSLDRAHARLNALEGDAK